MADHLTGTLGVSWELRTAGRSLSLKWAVAPVPEDVVEEFSSRSRHINAEADRLVAR
jgi:hypothetical protein